MNSPQNLLIFLIILLVCSITPAMAVQIGNTQNDDEYTYTHLYNDAQNILNVFEEASDTELTPEQAKYLETHQNLLKVKSEGMLYNIQAYLDYLLKESNRYNSSTGNSPKRSNVDIFTEDLNKMAEYLEKGTLNNMPIKIPIETKNCNYKDLNGYINGNDNKTPPVYNKSKVIVQIRDGSYNIRYMKLIDIDGDYIHLMSGSEDHIWSESEFNALHVWEDNSNSNPDRKFNIIIVPGNYSTDYVLRLIWDKQDLNLIKKESYVGAGNTILVAAMGTAGLAVATAGIYKLIDICHRGGQQAHQAEQAQAIVQEAAAEAVTETVPVVPPKEVAEAQPLLSNGQFLRIYGNAQNRLNQPYPQRLGRVVIITASLILAGILTATGSAIAIFMIAQNNGEYKKEHENLRKYEPPLTKIKKS